MPPHLAPLVHAVVRRIALDTGSLELDWQRYEELPPHRHIATGRAQLQNFFSGQQGEWRAEVLDEWARAGAMPLR